MGVSVHGVALPDGDVAGFLDGSDMVWEVVGDFGGAVAGDECDFSDFFGRVYGVEEGD